MHIPVRRFHPALRYRGALIRLVLPHFRVWTFRLCNRVLRHMKGRGGKGMRYEQITIPRPAESKASGALRLCVYRPQSPVKRVPGILWLHGGGYGLGIPEQDEGFIRAFVHAHDCVVVAPDYCLSTQAPYPAALEDGYAALLWLQKNAPALGVRTDQLMIGGDSAGGGLAAALAIAARDRGEVAIAFQMPLYPMLDDRMCTSSARDNDAPIWNTRSNQVGWQLYLGALYGREDVPCYAAPARLTDFRNLPPAATYIGNLEPFCDETIAYMEALRAAGVPADYRIFEGCYHAFDLVASRSAPAREARAFLMERFAHAMGHYFAPQPVDGD